MIQINDVNDHAPVLTGSYNDPWTFGIYENSSPGMQITSIGVKDKDAGRNAEVNCVIDSSYFNIVMKKDSYLYLYSTVVFDREKTDEIKATITCRDNGEPARQTSVEITVMIADQNDNVPYFVHSSYYFYYTRIPKDGKIGFVSARDRDEGRNGEIEYEISGTEFFTIDQESGLITTTEALSGVEIGEAEFVVTAKDKGRPQRSATTTVIVNLV